VKTWVLGTVAVVVLVLAVAVGIGYGLGALDDGQRSGSVSAGEPVDIGEAADETELAVVDEGLDDFCEVMWAFTTGQLADPRDWADTIDRAGVPDGMTARAEDGRELIIEVFRASRTVDDVDRQWRDFDLRERAEFTAYFAYYNQVCDENGEPRDLGSVLMDPDPDY